MGNDIKKSNKQWLLDHINSASEEELQGLYKISRKLFPEYFAKEDTELIDKQQNDNSSNIPKMKTYYIKLKGGFYRHFCTRLTRKQYEKICKANGGEITSLQEWKDLVGGLFTPLEDFDVEEERDLGCCFWNPEITVEDEDGDEICSGYQYESIQDEDELESLLKDDSRSEPLLYENTDVVDDPVCPSCFRYQAEQKGDICFVQQYYIQNAEEVFTLELPSTQEFDPAKLVIKCIGTLSCADGVYVPDVYVQYDGKTLEPDGQPDAWNGISFGVNIDADYDFDWLDAETDDVFADPYSDNDDWDDFDFDDDFDDEDDDEEENDDDNDEEDDDDNDEGNIVDVKLESYGHDKLMIVKLLFENSDLGLREAREIVSEAPVTILSDVEMSEAQKIKEILEDAGATIRILK